MVVTLTEFASHYQKTPARPCQKACGHNIRGRLGECAVCGSIKVNNRWWYLNDEWFIFYAEGKPAPSGYTGEHTGYTTQDVINEIASWAKK